VPRSTDLKFDRKLYCAVDMVETSKLVTIEVESRSSLRLHLSIEALHAALCTDYIDDHIPHAPFTTLQLYVYWGHGRLGKSFI
jgi:hypothetical protein